MNALPLILIAVLAAPPAPEPTTRDAFEQRLAEIDARASKVRDMQASFVQRKYSPLLVDPLISRGTIKASSAVMLWETREPDATVTRVDDERLRIYYVKEKVVEEFPLEADYGAMLASPLPRLRELRERFRIRPDEGDEDGDGFARPADRDVEALRLEPSDQTIAEHIAFVRVLLDATRGVVLAFEIVDVDGERTEIVFDQIRTNVGLDEDDLTLDLPRGVRVVRPLEGS